MTAPAAYSPPGFRLPIDLDLSKNEGRAPRPLPAVAVAAEELARYPDVSALRGALAALYGVPDERLLVTAGADDALLRLCLLALRSGGEALVASPTFEMIPRYAALAGGVLREVPWPEGPFPVDAFLAAAGADTRVAFVVSPNNPTGAVASARDLDRIARALPAALVVLDAAYAEFADEDLTAAALRHDNVVVVRTLSKAWGLAGLRVGCAIGTPAVVERLRASGNPMPVSIASARGALQRLATGDNDLRSHVVEVRRERRELGLVLEALGARAAAPAQGNFVLARGLDPGWVVAAAASLGVALRRFPDRADLADAVRIALPAELQAFGRLGNVLRAVLDPEALLFDLDGVLADVSGSYRVAIVETARSFGAQVADADVEAAKARGDANDDWALTRALMAARGVDRPLAEVTERFEARYRELRDREVARLDRETLLRWRRRFRLAVVTGRPRADADHFLARSGLRDVFDALVCREDAPLKPDPAPVELALRRLGVANGWMLGDTPDDLRAARGATVVPIGVVAPGADPARARAVLEAAGAAAVLQNPIDLEELLP